VLALPYASFAAGRCELYVALKLARPYRVSWTIGSENGECETLEQRLFLFFVLLRYIEDEDSAFSYACLL
jgi:hypothetical protein